MNILLTGASSLLGRYLIRWRPDGCRLVGTYNKHPIVCEDGNLYLAMNFSQPSRLYYAFNKAAPDVVIHCAGEGSVDACEREPKLTREINVDGTDAVLRAAAEYGAHVIYLSTNAVFDGENPPYDEESAVCPVNEYGSQKVAAERLVEEYPFNWTIIRPILLYGWPWHGGRTNWAIQARTALYSSGGIRVVNDRFTQPLYAGHLARIIWEMVKAHLTGIYHIAGMERMSLYSFACAAGMWLVPGAESADIEAKIRPVPSDTFPTLAPRPRDTAYYLLKMIGEGFLPQLLEEGLREMLADEQWGRG